MQDYANIEQWYEDEWAYDKWQDLPGYRPGDLDIVRDAYTEPPCLKDALANYGKEAILPWIGQRFGQDKTRLMVVLREYPLYTEQTFDEEGHAAMLKEVMQKEVKACGATPKMRTLKQTLRLAGELLTMLRAAEEPIGGQDVPSIADHIYLTDLVKVFALYAPHRKYDDKAPPLFKKPQKGGSRHTDEMYAFAFEKLHAEANKIGATHMLSLGWRSRFLEECKTKPAGAQQAGGGYWHGKLVALKHPQCRRWSWDRQVDLMRTQLKD